MQSLEALGDQLLMGKHLIEATAPGAFVGYNPMKRKSSQITLASDSGILKKIKKRSPEKTLYEFLALRVWHDIMKAYSGANNLTFRAPEPLGVCDLDQESPGLYMSYLNGYELQKMGALKRTTPVIIKGQRDPLPLFPACALHLGALNRIKEREGLLHSDYDTRHVTFSTISQISIGVVDVENSRLDLSESVQAESQTIFSGFRKHASSPRDYEALASWYHEGQEGLRFPDAASQVDMVLENIKRRFNVDFDFKNKSINGVHISGG